MRRSTKIAIVILISIAAGVLGAHRLRAESAADVYSRLDLFGDALGIVQNHYVREVGIQDLIYSAIEGMVSKLDAHSSFMPPKAFEEMQVETQGEFGGIGIEITIKDEWLTVVSPIEDTPASRAGLAANDRIVAIDGRSTRGMALENAVDLLRGKIGTKVTVTLHRARPATQPTGTGEAPGLDWNTEPFDVPLIRDKIRVKSVRAELKRNGDVLYVRLNQFQARTGSDLRRVLAENNAQSRKGIVLDLRNNPGGLLDQAIEVADAFLKEGKIVYTDGRDSSMHKEWFAADDGTEPGRPLVVLLNGGTASASEIVAGALKDHGAATLVGTRSFGKGSVQTILRLRDGSGIRLTTALYYTPSGRSIQAEGIRPDIEVADVTDLEEIRTREEDLDRHLTVTPDGPGIGNGATNSTRMLTVPEKIEKLQKGRDERERLKDAGQDPVLERGIAILLGEAPGATTSPAGATDRQ